MRAAPGRAPGTARNHGFSLLEAGFVLLLLAVILVPVVKFTTDSSRACSSLSASMHETSRALVILDRLNEELITANFASVVPAVPAASESLEFQKVVGVDNGIALFGDPIHIDLVSMEANTDDEIDNDGDGFVDEQGIRIWEDNPPSSLNPQAEDDVTVISGNVAKGGLHFDRQGAILSVDVTFLEAGKDPSQPSAFTLRTGVKMRNNQ